MTKAVVGEAETVCMIESSRGMKRSIAPVAPKRSAVAATPTRAQSRWQHWAGELGWGGPWGGGGSGADCGAWS